MPNYREKLEDRVKQLKKKLSGYVSINYTKSNSPKPNKIPIFHADTPPILIDIYSEYEYLNLGTTQGRIYIPSFNQLHFDNYEEHHLPKKHDASFLAELVTLSKAPHVVYHKSEQKIYLIEDLNFIHLLLTIQEYFDWQLFFLGIYDFQYFFVKNPKQYSEKLKISMQSLNYSFYEADMIPAWFEHDTSKFIEIHKPLQLGDRVKEFRHELSGVIRQIGKTKAIVEFDTGGTAEKLVRELAKVNDNIYEDLICGKKSILELSATEFKTLVECCYSRHSYWNKDFYQVLHPLYILMVLYKDIPLKDIFASGLKALKELNVIYSDIQSNNKATEWNFARHFILGGMFIACYWHLESNNEPNLSEALQAPLNLEVKDFFNKEEARDENIFKETPIGYLNQALSNWDKSDFDYLKLDKLPLGFSK
jgi:hypothetical protein